MAFTAEDKQFLLENFLTKQNGLTKQDAERFAKKEDLDRFATKEDLQLFATKDDLQCFATKEDMEAMRDSLEQRMELYHQRSNEHHLETRMMIRRLADKHEDLRQGLAEAAGRSK
jgi:hypothetical protein